MLTKNFGMISSEMNTFRAVITNIQQQAFKDLSMVATKLFDIYVKIGNIFMVLIKHLRNILEIMRYSTDTGLNMMSLVIALMNQIRVPINYVLRLT